MDNNCENKGLVLRIRGLIDESGLKKSKFAVGCEIDPSNFSKKLDGLIKFTELDIHKIASHRKVRWEWLITGEGDKKEGSVNQETLVQPTSQHDQMLTLAMKLAAKENECKMLKDMYEKAMAEREIVIKQIIDFSNQRL